MARPKKTVVETVQKDYPDFAQEVDGLPLDALEKRISTYAKEAEKVSKAKEDDIALEEVNEKKSELEGPYKDAKKAISLKIRYLIQRVKDKGGDA